ncbi:MAG: bacteriocin fulvocin C-related protein [Thermoanaerobaculia bacterium]
MKRSFGQLVMVFLVCTLGALPARGDLRAAAAGQYARLSTVTMQERRELFAGMPAAMQTELWTLHLHYFLDVHPELTAAQRSVVYEALGIVASGAFDVERNTVTWAERVGEPVAQLDARARPLFSPELFAEAFLELGPRSPRQTENLWVACDCNVEMDFCCILDCPTSPTPNCSKVRCIKGSGCGLLFLFACDGFCGP